MKTRTLAATALLTLGTVPAAAQTLGEPEGPNVTFSGFVDTSVYIPITGFPADGDEVTFGLDQVELDIEANPSDGLIIRTDINAFPAAGVPTYDDLFEQGYIDWEHDNGYFLRAGKANAPIGAEGIDPTDLYQYSQGQLFTSATPSNLTGFFTGYRSDSFSAQVWVTNDWDLPTTPRSASTGLRLEYAFDAGHVGLSSTMGPLPSDNPYYMVDLDTALNFGSLTILGEFNIGLDEALTRWGFLLTGSYAITESVSATLRVDHLAESVDAAPGVAAIDFSNTSLTAAGLFTLTDNFGLVAEVRTDLPEGGDPVVGSALELLAWW